VARESEAEFVQRSDGVQCSSALVFCVHTKIIMEKRGMSALSILHFRFYERSFFPIFIFRGELPRALIVDEYKRF
jgi:hypothetical protein